MCTYYDHICPSIPPEIENRKLLKVLLILTKMQWEKNI